MTTPMSLQPWSRQIFRLNTTVEVIFPNVCLWRRSLCSNLVLTLKKMYRATFICQYGLCCCNMALVSFVLFRKNLSNLRDFFGQMVYRPSPPPAKNFPYAYDRGFSKEFTIPLTILFVSILIPEIITKSQAEVSQPGCSTVIGLATV